MRNISKLYPSLTTLPNFPPKPQGQWEIAVRQSDQGPHLQGIGGSVEGASAASTGAGLSATTAFKCRLCLPPMADRGAFNR